MATATSSTLSDAVIQQFTASIRGNVIRPVDPRYDAARQVDNAMIDKRTALFARCNKVLLGVISQLSGEDSRPSFRDTRRDW